MPRNVSGFQTLLMLIQKHTSNTIVDFSLSLILSLLQETSRLLFTGGMELQDAVSQASSITLKVLSSTGKIRQLFGGTDILAKMRQSGMTLDHLPMVLGLLAEFSTFWTDIQLPSKTKEGHVNSRVSDSTLPVRSTQSKPLVTSVMNKRKISDRLQEESTMSSSSRREGLHVMDVPSPAEDLRRKRLRLALSKQPMQPTGPLKSVPGVSSMSLKSQPQKGTLDPWLTALEGLNIPTNRSQNFQSHSDQVDDEGLEFEYDQGDVDEWE